MSLLRLFFDECCSRRLPIKIKEIYDEDGLAIEAKHIVTDFLSQGKGDDVWIPQLEKDKDWIVITTDRGEDPKKPKLPILCKQFEIRHIVINPTLLSEGYAAQKQALLCVWPQIIKLLMVPRGTEIRLGYRFFKGGGTPWPQLTVENKSLDAWCNEKEIKFTKEKPKIDSGDQRRIQGNLGGIS